MRTSVPAPPPCLPDIPAAINAGPPRPGFAYSAAVEIGVAWHAVGDGLVGSDGVIDLAEAADFDGEGAGVVDRAAEQMLVFQGAEEPFDDAVGLRALDTGADVAQ